MKYLNTIDENNFQRVIEYAKRQKMEDIVEYMTANKVNLIKQVYTLQELLTAERMSRGDFDCFVRACYFFVYKKAFRGTDYITREGYKIPDSYIKIFNMFDSRLLLLNGDQKRLGDSYVPREDFDFNFEYIHKIVDDIASQNNFIFISWDELKNAKFTIDQLQQEGIVLMRGRQGEKSHYEHASVLFCLTHHQQYDITGIYLSQNDAMLIKKGE